MKAKNMSGFTLIEIMVVVVILGILAAIIVPKIMSRPDQARQVKVQQDVMSIQNALDLYKLDNGFYPTTDQGLQALVKKPTSDPVPQDWKEGGYLKQLPQDSWKHNYQYLNPGLHSEVDVFSYCADDKPGGVGVNADIGNWEAKKADDNSE